MKNAGFFGGSSLFELGTVEDMFCFFSLIFKSVELNNEEEFILRSLFRKYLQYDEIDVSLIAMSKIKNKFEIITVDRELMGESGWDAKKSTLNINCSNLYMVFERYFYAFEYCVQSALGFFDDWKTYKPVRVVISDMPEYLFEKNRPLTDYDKLGDEEKPFWLRSFSDV